jgi:CheY-like chemotaxis protein
MPSILVVDDEVAMREFVHRSLHSLELPVLAAGNAEDALNVLAQVADIAVAVVDLEMPGHGGAWLIDQIQERWPAVSIVLATVDEAVPGTLSLRAPVVRYIVKPVAGTDLVDAVREGLTWHETQLSSHRDASGADPVDAFLDRKLTHPEESQD